MCIRDRDQAEFYEATARWRGKPSGLTTLELWLGGTYVDGEGDNNTGYIGGVRASQRILDGLLTGEFNRSLRPSVFGNITEADLVRVGFSKPLSSRVRAGIGARYARRELEVSSATDKYQNIAAGPSISWQVAERFNVGFEYEFRWTDRNLAEIQGSASAHAGSISLRYLPGRDGRKK